MQPTPRYRIAYGYSHWGGRRQFRAICDFISSPGYGWRFAIITGDSMRDVYRRADSAKRQFARGQ